MLWWNQHLWLEYKLIKPAPPWTWAKGTSLLLWRTSFWPWSHTDLPSWGRFCGVKTPGSHRAQAPCLLDHTSYLGPYTSLWKWPSAHVRNFTGLFPVCFPTGGLCYWCVYLWPGGVANWGWLQGHGGSPRLRCSQGSTRGSSPFGAEPGEGRKREMGHQLGPSQSVPAWNFRQPWMLNLKQAFLVMTKVYSSR